MLLSQVELSPLLLESHLPEPKNSIPVLKHSQVCNIPKNHLVPIQTLRQMSFRSVLESLEPLYTELLCHSAHFCFQSAHVMATQTFHRGDHKRSPHVLFNISLKTTTLIASSY